MNSVEFCRTIDDMVVRMRVMASRMHERAYHYEEAGLSAIAAMADGWGEILTGWADELSKANAANANWQYEDARKDAARR